MYRYSGFSSGWVVMATMISVAVGANAQAVTIRRSSQGVVFPDDFEPGVPGTNPGGGSVGVWLLAFLVGLGATDGLAAEGEILRVLDVDVEHVVVRQVPSSRYAMYGGLTKLPDGEIFCVYKVGSRDPETNSPWTVRDETIVWAHSSSKGRSWPGEDNLIYENPSTRQENCCGKGYLAADGRLLHPFYTLNADYEEKAQRQNWAKLHLAVTKDMGETWKIRPVDAPLHLVTSFGGIVPLQDGTLLLHAYGAAEPDSFRHQSGILRSTDDGKTFNDYTIIGEGADPDGGHARLNETDTAELPSGELVSVSRTQYADFPLYQGVSSDKGRTWKVDRNGLTGLCPALCFTRSGPPEGILTLIYHDRWGKHASAGGIYAVFSTDEGNTWGEPVRMDHGAYPCLIEIAPGQMFTTFYRSFDLLRGAFFSVPFPSGLRARRPAGSADKVEVAWDAYRGKKAGDYTYQVHRSTRSDFPLTEETLIGSVQQTDSFVDKAPEPEKKHFYRVVAHENQRPVGRSWVACAVTAEKR